jgi:hypothetical protein
MTVSSSSSAALIALALSACAHGSPSDRTSTHPGGRAGQPSSWITSAETAAWQESARANTSGSSYLGGRASQPHAWLPSQAGHVDTAPAGEATCRAAGRDAQPFSGPTLRAIKAETERGDMLVCRSEDASGRF